MGAGCVVVVWPGWVVVVVGTDPPEVASIVSSTLRVIRWTVALLGIGHCCEIRLPDRKNGQ